jgi:hypothetical protein
MVPPMCSTGAPAGADDHADAAPAILGFAFWPATAHPAKSCTLIQSRRKTAQQENTTMSDTHMDPDRAFGLELLAAVQALPAGAAPLVAVLVRDGCISVPNHEAMLAALEGLGHAAPPAGAEAAVLAAWRASQARAPGATPDPTTWQPLADLGVLEQAHAAIAFALNVAMAAMQRATSDGTALRLH